MSAELSRRRALQIAGLGAAAAVAGGVGTWRDLIAPASEGLVGRGGDSLREPRVLRSSNGSLQVRLRAATGATVAGRRTQALSYDGTVPGPTLHVRPGDQLEVALVNDLGAATNLHTHGLHVSPEGRSDNIFRTVAAGATARYVYDIPNDHPSGTFWYHPHLHGSVANQVFGGLYGALVVAGADEPEVDRERVLVVSDTTLAGDGRVADVSGPQVMAGREGGLVLVNGQLMPRIDLAAGTLERWRVVNACASRFLRLALDGQTFGFLGYDGQALGAPREEETVLLAPGNRADLLVRPNGTGDAKLRTHAVDRGGMGMMSGGPAGTSQAVELATVRIAGPVVASPRKSPATVFPERRDLRGTSVDRRRTLSFTMGMGMGMSFGFDGREFDASRTDQRLRLGTVEEWVIGNDTPLDHPFHLHVWPMQVLEAPGTDPTGPPDWRDVVIVPARGRVRVRIPITDFGGRTVYHCHILDHEDRGMMGVAEASR
ncbi:MAG TPA: multicopper oxidase family protein [Marmoricola sp.]|nr:multicopper oxidase family protein [Marmoricola sp.]